MNEDYWNKGFMQEALREIIANAGEVAKFFSAAVYIDNRKSEHILTNLGFKFVKKSSGENGEENYYVLRL